MARADFDVLTGSPSVTKFLSVEQWILALGFNGAFAGIHLK
jgi:hypothetical protein